MVLKVPLNTGINRIRLEFKEKLVLVIYISVQVLIESDWNLKISDIVRIHSYPDCINRIRLEFKVLSPVGA